LEKSEGRDRKSAGLVTFDGFSDYFSFSGDRFADTFLCGFSEGLDQPQGNNPECKKKQKIGVP